MMNLCHWSNALVATWLFVAVPAFASAETPTAKAAPDTVLTRPQDSPPWTVRGVDAPLTKKTGLFRQAGRMVARIPYTALWLVARPPTALVGMDEKHGYSNRVMSWFTRDVENINTSFLAFVGYESGFGVTVLGVKAQSKNWYGTGLKSNFRFSYLNPSKNIFEMKFSGAFIGDSTFNTRTRFQRTPGRLFYGFGHIEDSPASEFDSQIFLNEFQVRQPLAKDLDFALLVYSRATRLRSAENTSLEFEFPGLWNHAEKNHYVGLEIELRRDTRDHREMASRGSLVRLAAGRNLARIGDDSDYNHFTAEYQYHHPLFRDRIIAGRVFYEGVDAESASALPFNELRGLGGRSNLRGYARGRFVDSHLIAASLEYRYPVTKIFQGRLFGDWGTVAPALDGLKLRKMVWSAGLGLAVQVGDGDLFVMNYSHGEEGGQIFVGSSSPFGYESRRKR